MADKMVSFRISKHLEDKFLALADRSELLNRILEHHLLNVPRSIANIIELNHLLLEQKLKLANLEKQISSERIEFDTIQECIQKDQKASDNLRNFSEAQIETLRGVYNLLKKDPSLERKMIDKLELSGEFNQFDRPTVMRLVANSYKIGVNNDA